MLVPIRAGNSNRDDYQSLVTSLLTARGDATTTAIGSVIWIETQAWARCLYAIWIANQKLSNQFDPAKMTDLLSSWEGILQLTALPTDTLTARRARVAAKFKQLGSFPNTQTVIDMLRAAFPDSFGALINDFPETAISLFPGGAPITGGSNSSDGSWFSTLSQLAVAMHQPDWMSDSDFMRDTQQVGSLIDGFIPAYDTFDWYTSPFTDDGATVAGIGLVTGSRGSTTLTGVSTGWDEIINVADGTKNLVPGSVFETFDDSGAFQRLTIASVDSDSAVTLSAPLTSPITSQRYWIAGFFLDCDSTAYPFPPAGCKNLDSAGFHF